MVITATVITIVVIDGDADGGNSDGVMVTVMVTGMMPIIVMV